MKKFLFFILALGACMHLSAQQMPQLPLDANVVAGQLENGMTYYIRHNDQPAQRAEFYLSTHVGALQEAPDQDGLAHFLEHMCFNGTKNFPGKSLLNYLQGIGASFGGNINASTGLEATNYMLNNMPIVREGIIDTCLLIMHDYSHFVTCDPAEIDAERGVIIEEKRVRNQVGWRNFMKEKEYIFKGSPLAKTSLIGSQTQLETFQPQSLVNFYRTWYRPDMQALIVVGDVDPKQIEQKIVSIFSDIPAAENPKQKEPNVVPANEEPIVGIITDPETTGSSISVYWKTEALPYEMRNTAVGFMSDVLEDIFSLALNERLRDIAAKPDAPFLQAYFGFEEICEMQDAVTASVQVEDGQAQKGLRAICTEVEKARRYGFSDAEYDRAKAKITKAYEDAAAKASTRKNAEFVYPLIYHFFHNEPVLDPADALEMVKQILPMLNSQVLNQAFGQAIPQNNQVVIYTAPEKEGIAHPAEAELAGILAEVAASEIEAPAAEETVSELMDASKLKGCKVKKETAGIHNITELTLANGAKVVFTPTDCEKNKISITLSKDGGQSLLTQEELPSFEDNVWTLFQQNCGVAGYSGTTLLKILAGKTVSCTAGLSDIKHHIDVSTTPADLETGLQLLYLNFTQPRFDAEEYNQGVKQLQALLPNLASNPDFVMSMALNKYLYGENPRQIEPNAENLAKVDVKVAEAAYKRLFKDAAGAIVYVTGDFKTEDIKDLVVKYVGSLPKGRKAQAFVDRKMDFVDGVVEKEIHTPMQGSAVTVYQVYKTPAAYDYKTLVAYEAASYILDMIYTDTMREEEGGTYGASTQATIRRRPTSYGYLLVGFATNKDMQPKLCELARKGIEQLATAGPTEEQFTRTVNNFTKNIPESRVRLSYWARTASAYETFGEDYDALYEEAVKSLTPEAIKDAAASFLASGNFFQLIQFPEE